MDLIPALANSRWWQAKSDVTSSSYVEAVVRHIGKFKRGRNHMSLSYNTTDSASLDLTAAAMQFNRQQQWTYSRPSNQGYMPTSVGLRRESKSPGLLLTILVFPVIDTAPKAGILSRLMDDIKIALAKAVVKILNPVVRILLKYEVSHSEFAELAKRSYVNVANQYFSIPGRKKTHSRVAVLTGLSRKEVVRLTKIEEDQPPVTKGPLNRAARVISGWLRDPDFVDQNNEPKELPLRGDNATFELLVERYSGDITARAILDELVRVGAVTKTENKTVILNHHGYIPQGNADEKIDVMAVCAADLLNAAVHNINLEDEEDVRFQRQTAYVEIPEHIINEFKQLSHDRSLELLLELNKWLADKKKTVKPKAGERTGRVGIGIYYIQDELNENDK